MAINMDSSSRIEELKLSDIVTGDRTYQRLVSNARVQKLKENFDVDAVGIPAISHRSDGTYHAIDGQHRTAVMKELGIEEHLFEVFHGLSLKREAEIYTIRNNDISKNTPLEKFKARLMFEDPIALDIQAVLDELGLHVRYDLTDRSKGGIRAIAGLDKVYDHGSDMGRGKPVDSELGKAWLETVLKLAMDAWPEDEKALHERPLVGLLYFLKEYGNDTNYDENQFVAKVRPYSVSDYCYQRADYHSRMSNVNIFTGFMRTFVELYNMGKGAKLKQKVLAV